MDYLCSMSIANLNKTSLTNFADETGILTKVIIGFADYSDN
jgi:hypothetical protein